MYAGARTNPWARLHTAVGETCVVRFRCFRAQAASTATALPEEVLEAKLWIRAQSEVQ